jgi:hypothetical protein
LVWYEQNLEVLEKAMMTRQAHKAAYASNAELVERWKATYDSLNGRIEQAEKAMDTLDQRNLT